MDIRMIFLGANVAKQIAGYLGLVETLNVKLDRLVGSEFEAALRSLEQAGASISERDFLLREARSRFNKSISLEDNERLAMSYIGLAFCHAQLGDSYNAREALRAVKNIEIKGKAASLAKAGLAAVLLPGIGPAIPLSDFAAKKARLEEVKKSVQSFLESGYEHS
jgi:hypothetical protein